MRPAKPSAEDDERGGRRDSRDLALDGEGVEVVRGSAHVGHARGGGVDRDEVAEPIPVDVDAEEDARAAEVGGADDDGGAVDEGGAGERGDQSLAPVRRAGSAALAGPGGAALWLSGPALWFQQRPTGRPG